MKGEGVQLKKKTGWTRERKAERGKRKKINKRNKRYCNVGKSGRKEWGLGDRGTRVKKKRDRMEERKESRNMKTGERIKEKVEKQDAKGGKRSMMIAKSLIEGERRIYLPTYLVSLTCASPPLSPN